MIRPPRAARGLEVELAAEDAGLAGLARERWCGGVESPLRGIHQEEAMTGSKKIGVHALLAFAAAVTLAGCAGGGKGGMGAHRGGEPALGESEVRYGRIERIDPVSLEGDHQLGVGHVLGAVAGGVIGHQFGHGSGQLLAQVLGSVGGGYLGGQIQNKYVERRPGQHITVTLNSGIAVGVTQPADAGLRVGDCVRVDGSGQNARVVRADCVPGGVAAGARPVGERLAAEFGPQGETVRQRLQARLRQADPAPLPAAGAARPLGESPVRFGRIVSIEAIQVRDETLFGLHHVANGVAGQALGYGLPGGGGREFAETANALGGGSASAPARAAGQPRAGQYVMVKLDNGIVIGISQLPNDTLRVGDRVRIEGSGADARVVRV
jgi:outer membrane lipoprotein SlyB